MNEYAATLTGWSKVPFFWLALLALAFAIGTLIQDLYNRDSWLARLWRALHRLFELRSVRVTPENSADFANFNQRLIAQIKARRRMPNAELTVTALVIDDQTGLRDTFVFDKRTSLHLADGEALDICLAMMPGTGIDGLTRRVGAPEPKPPPPMRLGENGQPFGELARIWFEIELRSGLRLQQFLIYFRAPVSQQPWGLNVFTLQREDESVFSGIRQKNS